MLEEQEWKAFWNAGLLWWTNRALHLFGWAIVFVFEADGTISRVYPARTKYRGFAAAEESAGFVQLTQHMRDNADTLLAEAKE